MTIQCPSFTEVVKYARDGKYMVAHGWTQSGGQTSTSSKYALPDGWRFDERFSDERGRYASHGGCKTCAMTLVHLISIDEQPYETPWGYIVAAIVVLYMLTKG